ncbi:IclR family transcriptional regulator [uncultured Selenomonas sp.]|uniref:IclR family transcriptional regulator n=1 Tax=uncultured Selenomonas sp. TaxID=159275 RepID=UPI0025D635E9|nr:IclR family transcriptional regulator [uncultured Selenomonas sp.]
MTDTQAPKVKSLYKALHLLDYFDADHPDAGVTELAAYSGMLKSSVHNILQTFELCGFVTQDSETSRYLLGSAAVSLFSRYKETRRLDYRITEYLQGLRDKFRKDIYFAARDQGDAVCLSAELSQPSAASWSKVGARAPLHATSLGKVLLGYATVEEKRAYCAQELVPCTPQTITDGTQLAAELERIIYDGCATTDGEYQASLHSIAVPVTRGAEPVVYAIGLASDEPISAYMKKQYLSELRYIAKKIAGIVGRR